MREWGVGERDAGEARRRTNPANHEAESCYVTGEGGTEENGAQTSEICYTDARWSRIPDKGRIPRKFFLSKLVVYQDSGVYI